MKYRFLIHELNHTILMVDITSAGLPNEIYPPEGKPQSMPSLRFRVWTHARSYLSPLGAGERALEALAQKLAKTGVSVLTMVWGIEFQNWLEVS